MKIILKIVLLVCLPVFSIAQNTFYNAVTRHQADSIRNELVNVKNDTVRMILSKDLCNYYSELNFDSSLYYGQQVLDIARKYEFKLWEAAGLYCVGLIFTRYENYPKALESYTLARKIAEDENSEKNIPHIEYFTSNADPHYARLVVLANTIHDFGVLYGFTGSRDKDMFNKYEAMKIAESIDDKVTLSVVYANLSFDCLSRGKFDSGYILNQKAIDYAEAAEFKLYEGYFLNVKGIVFTERGKYDSATYYFKKGVQASYEQNASTAVAGNYAGLSRMFKRMNMIDSSIYYLKVALKVESSNILAGNLVMAYRSLASFYKEQNKPDSALKYLSLSIPIRDSLHRAEKENLRKYQAIGFDEQLRLQESEKEKIAEKSRVRTIAMLAGLGVFLIFGLLLYRNNRQKQKANRVLENTLADLKSTQSQLIQSEKMASLGELTAGIAHEIQNPLNFVNNFAEVNNELIEELKSQKSKLRIEEQAEILNDVFSNNEKISHHGKRADAIVKGMLQHSRSSSGQKEPTDINALADEYLRLAYHGLRAKDKSFNATLVTNYDKNIGKVNIIPQDFGRAILNLITNAFFAVDEKQKQQIEGFEPTVWLSTKKLHNQVEIRVKDNGNGIPKKVLDKIFQPFFTTKPTGKGTGLGLSLTYDIVKAHGGEIKAETKEGEAAEFVIILPV